MARGAWRGAFVWRVAWRVARSIAWRVAWRGAWAIAWRVARGAWHGALHGAWHGVVDYPSGIPEWTTNVLGGRVLRGERRRGQGVPCVAWQHYGSTPMSHAMTSPSIMAFCGWRRSESF